MGSAARGRAPAGHARRTTLADKVFTPTRVEVMLRELRKRQRAARSAGAFLSHRLYKARDETPFADALPHI